MTVTQKAMVVLVAMIATLAAGTCVSAKTLTLKLQSHLIPAEVERTLGDFKKRVAELTDGQIQIKLFSGSSMFPMKEVLEAVGMGALDMAMIAEGYWHKKIPVSEVAGLPFAFRTAAEAKYFMFQKGFADILRQEYAKHNVHHMPYEPYAVGLMTNKPIMKMEDLKGMRIRAYGVMAEWLTQMGATTTYIPGGELYTALAMGVVAGAHWADAGPMYTMKFQEVLKNYMLPEPIQGSWNSLIVNMDVWKKLSPAQQSIIETTAMAVGHTACMDSTRIISEIALNKMTTEWDVKVNTLPDEEVGKMQNAAAAVWEKVAKKDPLNAKVISMMKDFLKELGHIK